MRKFLLKRHRLALALLMLFAAFTQVQAQKLISSAADLIAAAKSGFVDGSYKITTNIDMVGQTYPVVTPKSKDITIDGGGYTISNLTKPLVSSMSVNTGGRDLTFKNLTIDNANINIKSTDEIAVGAFIAMASDVHELNFENCKLTNSKVSEGHWLGGFVGFVSGYANANDGPLFCTVNITDCSATGNTLKSEGSVGAFIGQAGANSASKIVVTNPTSTGNTIKCTGSSKVKAGALFGSVNEAGGTTAWKAGKSEANDEVGGCYVGGRTTISDNTITSGGATIDGTQEYGRVTGTGRLYTKNSDGEWGYYTSDNTFTKGVAQIGTTVYTTIEDAITAASGGDSIVVFADNVEVTSAHTDINITTVGDYVTITDDSKYVAQVGDNKYATLHDAIDAATDGQTVQLLADITDQNTTLTINKSLTLDLKGHTLSGEGGGGNTTRRMFLLQLDKSKTVTITDSGNGNGISMTLPEATFGGDNFCIDQHQGTLKLTNVKVAFNTANATLGGNPYAVYVNYGANLNIENSTITATDKLRPMPVGTGNSVMNNVKTSVNIESSTLEAKATPAGSSTSTWAVGLRHSGAEATINNTVIKATSTGKGAYCVRNYGDLVTVKGDSSQFKTSAPAWAICMTTESDSSKLDVQDGTFSATVPDDATNLGSSQMLVINNDATETVCTISGGKFLVEGKETSLFNGGIRHIQLTGGYYSVRPNSVCLASGYGFYDLTGVEGYSYEVAPVVAQIGTTVYKSLQEAFDAATEGQTITLANNASGNGVILYASQKKNLTLDLSGHTYTVSGKAVGSKNTENQAFHFEKGNTVTIKNGKLTSTSSEVIMFIQNYSNLTLDGVTVDATNIRGTYAVSNNCGSLTTSGATTITAPAGGVAFDVYYWYPYYREGVSVTINEGTKINGKIEYDAPSSSPDNWEEKTNLKINGGTFSNFSIELYNTTTPYKAGITISGGTFDAAVNEDYCAADYVPTLVDGRYTVEEANENNAVSYTTTEDWLTEKSDSRTYITGSKIVLTDNDSLATGKYWSFKVPVQKEGQTITYTRTFSNNNDQGWFVPFSVNVEDYKDQVRFYAISVTTAGAITFSTINSGTLEANHPYVVRSLESTPITVTFTSSDSILYKTDDTNTIELSAKDNKGNQSEFTISGNYSAKPVTDTDKGWYTLSSKGNLSYRSGNDKTKNITLKPFRWFLKDKNSTSASKSAISIIHTDDDVTGINSISASASNKTNVIYDLQGHRVNNPEKGIYIINGKKVLVK